MENRATEEQACRVRVKNDELSGLEKVLDLRHNLIVCETVSGFYRDRLGTAIAGFQMLSEMHFGFTRADDQELINVRQLRCDCVEVLGQIGSEFPIAGIIGFHVQGFESARRSIARPTRLLFRFRTKMSHRFGSIRITELNQNSVSLINPDTSARCHSGISHMKAKAHPKTRALRKTCDWFS
jgi:hypothetical protein